MLTITKSIEKKIGNISKQLPVTTYGVKKHVYKRLDDKRVERTTFGEDLHVVNHKNRLKTAYKSGGVEAVKKYVEDVIALSQARTTVAVDL
jgi:predicted phage-related endonuclease